MAVVLAYDDLPGGSDISREVRPDGVRFIIPPGEVTASTRRGAFATSLAPALMITFQILMLICGIGWFLLLKKQYTPSTMLTIAALLLVVIAAIFGLVLRELALSRIHVLQSLRLQATFVDADAKRLHVESSGPLGEVSRTIPSSAVRGIQLVERRHRNVAFPAVVVRVNNEEPLTIAVGRDQRELRWLERSVRAALQLEEEP